jgi:CheY-like chemotaxis protein
VDSPAGISVATVPLIMLSSSRHAVDIQRAYQVGANSYQVKPATSDALLSVMTVLKTYCFQNNQNLTGGIQT